MARSLLSDVHERREHESKREEEGQEEGEWVPPVPRLDAHEGVIEKDEVGGAEDVTLRQAQPDGKGAGLRERVV